jgi:hypothetical protein
MKHYMYLLFADDTEILDTVKSGNELLCYNMIMILREVCALPILSN